MLFWILLLKLALPAARPHRSPSSRRQHSCPGPGPAAPGGPAAETAPAPGTSVPAPAPAPFPAEAAAAAAAAATTAATAAAASPLRLISSGVKPFMPPRSGAPAPTEIPAPPRRSAWLRILRGLGGVARTWPGGGNSLCTPSPLAAQPNTGRLPPAGVCGLRTVDSA